MEIIKAEDGLQLTTTHEQEDIVWFDAAKCDAFRIFGAAKTDPNYRRLPDDLAEQLRPELQQLSLQTAGIRARFWTDSPYIALHIHWDLERTATAPWRGMRGFDLYSIHNGKHAFETAFMPPLEYGPQMDYTYKTFGDLREYLLNWPLYNYVDKVYIGLKAGSRLERGGGYHNELPVVFYGSSITQGAHACRSGNAYQNFLSRALDMDYINMGYSGNCKGDPILVDYMAQLPMSAFVCDFDHNAANAEELEERHYEVYRRIREKNPDLPYIMVTKPDYRQTNWNRKIVIMESYQKALATGDRNVYFIDGTGFFTGEEREACTMDGTHPNDLGMYWMAQGMVHILRRILYGGGLY